MRSSEFFGPAVTAHNIVFRPAGLGSNGSSTYFRGTFEDVIISSVVTDGLTNTFKSANVLQIGLGETAPVQNYSNTARLLAQTPSTLANTTKFIILTMQIENFGNVVGCTVRFRAALVR